MVSPSRCCGAGALLAFALLGLSSAVQADVILADNLAQATGGSDSATGTSWLAASFSTDGSAYTLSSLTLELARTSISGTAVVFTGTAGTLLADTTYWVVLRAVTGAFEWSWASTNLGAGAGFSTTTATTDDAGSTWFTATSYPYQMSVSATAVPEPGSIVLAALGAACAFPVFRRVRRRV